MTSHHCRAAVTILLLTFLGGTSPPELIAAERPNIVLFIADDVSYDDLGCYGNNTARTPNIDRLARHGLTFDNAFLTASSCSPSRCSIVTGRYPHNNGPASELHRPLPSHLIKFPSLLKKSRYYTALAGKDHMPQDDAHEEDVWDRKEGPNVPGNSGGEGHWLDVVQSRPKDQPFFFWFAAIDAHRGWDADNEWDADRYGPMHDPAKMIIPAGLADTPETREDLASYHNEITRFDWYIGQIVEELNQQSVLEDTLIIVMADNGRPFPRGKTRVHDCGMKTPFVAHWPNGISHAGNRCDSLISAIDLCPTVLELAAVEIPEQVQGRSFSKLFEDPDQPFREYAFSEHNWHDYAACARSVRDDDGYLYILNLRPEQAWLGPADAVSSPSHNAIKKLRDGGTLSDAQADVFLKPRPEEELYFTADDSDQIYSLVDATFHEKKLEELRQTMQTWRDVTGDSLPENPTKDFYDRETGYTDSRTGRRIRGNRPYGDYPGHDRDAAHINEPGPN